MKNTFLIIVLVLHVVFRILSWTSKTKEQRSDYNSKALITLMALFVLIYLNIYQ